ncbi:hypothetical protein SCB29_03435 [Paraburkholderia sp. SIMBA_055]|nr:hypothetical protein EN871_32110 [bacterium M00.F.Ca.ET.228.01.1.1]TGR95304.1 hypothetical protein EN834_32095 [bacterium M00.F.Ca.ET.191.01.1.1]TGT96157.1 hypothetical protein EN798_32105 [bacterium M00.F.Ca.ET.155.01.1.1]
MLGNPLIAIIMMRLDVTVGLFAPVELLLSESLTGNGAVAIYVKPSQLICAAENPDIHAAAVVLDEKLEKLVCDACLS